MKIWKHWTFVGFLVIIAFVLGIAACGNNGDPSPPQSKTFTVTFNADNGTTNTTQTIAEGEKASEPTAPTKANDVAGLYAGTPPTAYTLDGWYNGETKWNFDIDTVIDNTTLTAKWIAPTTINLSDVEKDNIVAKAVAYINTPSNAGTYTLLLNTDVNLAPQTLDVENVQLTLIGIGEERKIKLSENGRLFLVGTGGETGIELTLGNNITLVGRSIGGNGNENNGNNYFVYIYGANFTMLDGSKITGNTGSVPPLGSGGVVHLDNSIFTMKGGIIIGNSNIHATMYMSTGGLSSNGNSTIKLEGGSIIGNTGNIDRARDVRFTASDTFTLSGNTVIGTLTMSATLGNTNPSAIIASSWNGNITSLNLYGNNSEMDAVISYWNGKEVFKATDGYILTTADITKVQLGDFLSSTTSLATQSINETHKLELDITNNVIRLVVK